MASNKFIVADLDFDAIKSNLKAFLQDQTQFSDYNFEGSGFSVLLDTLAYNTHYLGFNANMLTNEMYLDSADIRKNIVSLAKMLGYTPSSPKSPRASVDITLNDGTGSAVTMDKGTTFTSVIDNVTYQFITNEDITMTPINGVYKFSNVPLYEGTLVSFRYTVDSNDVDQRYIIPNVNADTTTLKVSVQTSANDTTLQTYSLASGLKGLNDTSKAYFLKETETGKFEVYFGDGIIGNKLADGNIVILEYIITNKEEANGASVFKTGSAIGGFTDITIVTKSNAEGGAEAESKESIRFNAPLQYTAQNRAVTTSDYETKVIELYPNASSVVAWGGEDDETPVYGKVKIAIKPKSGSTLTTATKNSIVTSLKTFNVASVKPEIVDAETTNILLQVTVKYNKNKTALTAETLESNVTTTVTNYNSENLAKFDGVFRFSKLVGLIDDTDNSIISNITTLRMRKTFTPITGTSTSYNIYFRNAIFNPHSGHNMDDGGVIETSGFKVEGDTDNEYFLDDDGKGNIRRYRLSGSTRVYANSTQGTINYSTGAITINSLNISSVSNIRSSASTVIEITTTPESNDLAPVRGQVLEIDVANSTINVQEDTFEGGSSDAGVGYTTPSSYTNIATSY